LDETHRLDLELHAELVGDQLGDVRLEADDRVPTDRESERLVSRPCCRRSACRRSLDLLSVCAPRRPLPQTATARPMAAAAALKNSFFMQIPLDLSIC